MKILFINYEFPPIGGGGANATRYLFREFAKCDGLTIDCVTSGLGDNDLEENFSPNIQLHRLAVGKRELHYWTQREILTFLRRAHNLVGKLMHTHEYDCCHAFFGFPSGALSWARRKELPYLVSLRGSDVPGFNPRFAAQYVLLKPLFRRIWNSADKVVANSEGLMRLANTFMPKLPIGIIPNGIDIDEFSPARADEVVPGRILCVSRLVERKGVQDLVEAMPAILTDNATAHLVIVGEGDLLETLRNRCRHLAIDNKVDLRGYVPHEELPDLYRSAELFVQPSYYEGMSNTVLEAMASGLPIVATGEGGKKELLQENAEIVPYGNPKALSESVVSLLLDSSKLAGMGTHSRQIAEQFSWEAVARSYLALYRTAGQSHLTPHTSRHGS